MESWHSYPKVWALGHKETADIFKSNVIIEEKIDGSQFNFGRFGDEIKVRSRGGEIILDAPEKMFTAAINTVKELAPILKDGWTYSGEYLCKPKHNVLAYDRIPEKCLIIFDIKTGNEQYLSYPEKKAECERIGLEVVPLIFEGIYETPTEILKLIDSVSLLGGQKMEGIVVKNYSLFGGDKKVVMGKYVSEAFKEIHKVDWKANNPGRGDVVALLTDSLRTPSRWHKSVQHLKEKGVLEGSPKDIGNLMKEFEEDLKIETQDLIKQKLFEWAWPQILRGTKRGLPEWCKELLVKETFG